MICRSDVKSQRTLKTSIHCRGIGLHSGARLNMTLRPGLPGSGVVFRRTDQGGAEIPANWRNIVDSTLCTTLGNRDGVTVATVEHLMSALAGLEIDNAEIEIDGAEVPVMDGSAAPFVFLIECAGIVEQPAPRRAITVLKRVSVGTPGKSASLVPDDTLRFSFAIDFASSAIRRQELSFSLDSDDFKHGISRARTFGFLDDLDRLREAGLARGGSLDNAVVIAGDRVLNREGLRYSDEFVRHKVLDAMGDLYLAGGPLLGHFHGVRSGHATNRRLLEALFSDPANWRYDPIPTATWEDAPQRARA